FLPFMAESMYQNLVRSVDPGAPESVHHTGYPDVVNSQIDRQLVGEMDLARRIVSLGHAARKSAGLRVRQPLSAVRVAGATGRQPGAEVLRLVADELNVKRVELGADLGDLVTRSVRLNPAKAGPKYGSTMRALNQALQEQRFRVLDDRRVEVEGLMLEPDEVNGRLEAAR